MKEMFSSLFSLCDIILVNLNQDQHGERFIIESDSLRSFNECFSFHYMNLSDEN